MTSRSTALVRWEIDLERGAVTAGALGPQSVEMPRVDERRHGNDFDGEPTAVVQLPRRVPIGLHGSWVPD